MKTAIFFSYFLVVCIGLSQNSVAYEINVSGRDGQDGSRHNKAANGRAGSDSYSGDGEDGSPGKNGEHAREGAPGQNAGSISISLEQTTQSFQGKIVVSGVIESPTIDVERSSYVEKQDFEIQRLNREPIALDLSAKINLSANGGKGGDGGRGGDGGDGGDGGKGDDASRYSSGDDGGDGGKGGDGGRGTRGKRPGNGGNVSVTVSENQTDLLMLLGNISNRAGTPGAAGENGVGGRGGDGGRGGSSHSWTECDTKYRSDGKGGSESYQDCDTYRKPGGSSGSSGSRGRDGNADVSGGPSGKDGVFKIIVSSSNGAREYSRRYDVNIRSFKLSEATDAHRNNIYEPGERVKASNFVVTNSGGMPTPPNHPIEIQLTNSQWVSAESLKITIAQSIPNGATVSLPGELFFKIPNHKSTGTSALFRNDTAVSAHATQTNVNRRYENSNNNQPFQVSFPIEIEQVFIPKRLGLGQSSRLYWKVKNRSNQDLGGQSEFKRIISQKLNIKTENINNKTISIVDNNGRHVELSEGFFTEIASLKAGETKIIELGLTVRDDAELYSKVSFDLGLNFSDIEDVTHMS